MGIHHVVMLDGPQMRGTGRCPACGALGEPVYSIDKPGSPSHYFCLNRECVSLGRRWRAEESDVFPVYVFCETPGCTKTILAEDLHGSVVIQCRHCKQKRRYEGP